MSAGVSTSIGLSDWKSASLPVQAPHSDNGNFTSKNASLLQEFKFVDEDEALSLNSTNFSTMWRDDLCLRCGAKNEKGNLHILADRSSSRPVKFRTFQSGTYSQWLPLENLDRTDQAEVVRECRVLNNRHKKSEMDILKASAEACVKAAELCGPEGGQVVDAKDRGCKTKSKKQIHQAHTLREKKQPEEEQKKVQEVHHHHHIHNPEANAPADAEPPSPAPSRGGAQDASPAPSRGGAQDAEDEGEGEDEDEDDNQDTQEASTRKKLKGAKADDEEDEAPAKKSLAHRKQLPPAVLASIALTLAAGL